MLAFTLATVMVVVLAPLFGYKFDLIMTTLNDLGVDEKALTSGPAVVDPTYGGYSGYTGQPQPPQGYRMMAGGSSGLSLSSLGGKILHRSDLKPHCLYGSLVGGTI